MIRVHVTWKQFAALSNLTRGRNGQGSIVWDKELERTRPILGSFVDELAPYLDGERLPELVPHGELSQGPWIEWVAP